MITILYKDELPIRLDRLLKTHYPLITNGAIQKAIRKKEIKINLSRASSAADKVKCGDEVSIFTNWEAFKADCSEKEFGPSTKSLAEKIRSKYKVFENEQFLVINKPSKLATQGGTKLITSVDDALQYINHTEGTNLKLVHRLDKDTSGLLLVAKSRDSARLLAEGFRNRLINKTYIALTSGKPATKEGVVEKDDEVTMYKVLKYDTISNVAKIEFKPVTGKEHQIRRHAVILGAPIIGDKRYGVDSAGYMMLHAMRIELPKEIFGRSYSFNAEPPEYFTKLEKMCFDHEKRT